MEAKVNQQSEFLEIVSNFNFDIVFHDEKYPKGRISWYEPDQMWSINPKEDYWNFDIAINGHRLVSLITNYENIKYEEFLETHLNKFINNHDNSSLKELSKSDCFDLLSNELEKLNYIKAQFYTKEIKYEPPYYITHEIQMHRKFNISFSEIEKVFNRGEDYFIYTCISSCILRQKDIIESAISILKKKLQWLDLRKEETHETFSEGSKSIDLTWCKTDTALLELVTALMEMKAINNSQNNLTRKEAIDTFSKIFGIEIKDAESKLSRATERKRDVSFPTALKESFDNYVIRKDLK